jgi:Skp family chaperone for outer membrane proteins
MNLSVKSVLVGLVLAVSFCCGICCPKAAAAGEKFAYVDVAKVVEEYQKTKDNDATFQTLGKQKEEERQVLVRDIKQLKDELALLADDAKAKKQEAIDEKVRQLQDFDQVTQRDLTQQRNKILKEIFQDIDDTVQRYGERKGVDFIFNERVLVYRNGKYDVTQDVLAELNQNFSKKK